MAKNTKGKGPSRSPLHRSQKVNLVKRHAENRMETKPTVPSAPSKGPQKSGSEKKKD